MIRKLSILLLLALFVGCGGQGTSSGEGDPLGGRDPEGDGPGVVNARAWHLVAQKGVNILPAWQITRGSSDVVLAIIDSGFLPNHSAFARGQCISDTVVHDFVRGDKIPGNHGASVASLIGTCRNNPSYLTGINDYASMIWLERGRSVGQAVALLEWAVGVPDACSTNYISCPLINDRPATILNLSFGNTANMDESYFKKLYLPVIQYANERGSIIIAAAGNDAINAGNDFPAAATGVISAGSTNRSGVSSYFSNWGETVEIMAPGEDISVAAGSSTAMADGTSFSAPIVTGIVSLMKTVYPELNWKTAVYFLQSTATRMSCSDYCSNEYSPSKKLQCQSDCCVGAEQVCTPGRVDAGAAVAAAKRAADEGLPVVALVDSDKYFVPMGYLNGQASFTLRNVGGAGGTFQITSDNPSIVFTPDQVSLAKKGEPGDSALVQLVGNVSQITASQGASIRVASASSGKTDGFSDEMTLFLYPEL